MVARSDEDKDEDTCQGCHRKYRQSYRKTVLKDRKLGWVVKCAGGGTITNVEV